MVDIFIAFFEYLGNQNWFIQWCALWLLWAVVLFPLGLARIFLLLISRIISSRNIRKNGWPPAHLDGLGRIIEKEEKK